MNDLDEDTGNCLIGYADDMELKRQLKQQAAWVRDAGRINIEKVL